jgi:NAD(P)-dependent dehydrogenase (short-subunit alcohol dehydrogenase family)
VIPISGDTVRKGPAILSDPEGDHKVRSTVVTGVSRGLGAALFAEAYRLGDRVVGVGRNFTEEQRRLAAGWPDRVALLDADLALESTIPPAKVIAEALGDCTEAVLLLNAAVIEPLGTVGSLTPAELVSAVTVNLTAPMLLTNAFVAALPPSVGWARVLFISSSGAHHVTEGTATYSATKRGGEKFFEVAAAELAEVEPRVTVCVVDPGIMDTDMQAVLRSADFPHRDRYIDRYRRGELPEPAAVAQRILASEVTT